MGFGVWPTGGRQVRRLGWLLCKQQLRAWQPRGRCHPSHHQHLPPRCHWQPSPHQRILTSNNNYTSEHRTQIIYYNKLLYYNNIATNSASQTNPPAVFWRFFPNDWEFLINVLHTYYAFISTLDYKFFIQFCPTLTKLCHTKRDTSEFFYISLEL